MSLNLIGQGSNKSTAEQWVLIIAHIMLLHSIRRGVVVFLKCWIITPVHETGGVGRVFVSWFIILFFSEKTNPLIIIIIMGGVLTLA